MMWLRSLGTLLVVAGLLLLVLIFTPVVIQEINYQLRSLTQPEVTVISSPDEAQKLEAATTTELKFQPTVLVPKSFDFSLVIPKIGVNSLVFPDIDSSNEAEYLPVLKEGVAHAKYSSLPNQPGAVFLFSHSTDSFYNIGRYNAEFFLLRKLETGDEIYLFYQNQHYKYVVAEKKVVDPDQVSTEVNQTKGNVLILQTCHPPGTTLQRLLIFSTPGLDHS